MSVGVLLLRKAADGTLFAVGPFPEEVAWAPSTLEKLGWDPSKLEVSVPTPNGDSVTYEITGVVAVAARSGGWVQAVTSRRPEFPVPWGAAPYLEEGLDEDEGEPGEGW